MRRNAGFVLLNALIVVIAISAIATAVLSLSARATARLSVVQADTQLALYLDGAEALITTFLEQEWEQGGVDHLGELWAGDSLQVPIDRGRIAAELSDMQGRMNLNRLTLDGDARGEFERLFSALNLPMTLLNAVEGYLSDGGPSSIAPYLGRPVPVLPKGGVADLPDALRHVDGMTEAAFARLMRFATVLPVGTQLNINTAPPEVLRAVLSDLGADQISSILRSRQATPFESGLDFRIRIAGLVGERDLQTLPLERFTAQTAYFEALTSAELDGRFLQRRLIVFRDDAADGETRVLYALPVSQAVPAAPAP